MSSVKGQRWGDVKPCGSTAAYRRHYRHGEKPCFACRQAWSRFREDQRTGITHEADGGGS
jgi:cytidine deaminase